MRPMPIDRHVLFCRTEMTLLDFVTSVTPTKPLIENITIPTKPGQQESMTVMSKLGRRILHGVLSCVLNAHGAGLVYDGVSQMDDFRVYVYQGTTEFARVVYARDAMLRTLPEGRFIIRQKEVYQTLAKVIEELFPFAQMPLHVQSIHILLDYKLAECMPAGPPQKRTQLLQAVAAMVSSSVGVATMWLNLKRFYDHLDSKKKPAFRQAITLAEIRTDKLAIQVDEQTLFKTVYDNNGKAKKANTNTSAAGSSSSRRRPQQDQAPKTPYAGDIGIFDFARNWFTHVPDERWTPPPVRTYTYCADPSDFVFYCFLQRQCVCSHLFLPVSISVHIVVFYYMCRLGQSIYPHPQQPPPPPKSQLLLICSQLGLVWMHMYQL